MPIRAFAQDRASAITDRVATGKRRYFHTEKIRSHIDGPFTTGNLVFHLDPRNTASWPGSGTTLFDLSGNDHDFTMNGNPTFSSAEADGRGAFQYDGTDDLFYLEHSDAVRFKWGPSTEAAENRRYSIEFWVKLPNPTTYRSVITKTYASITQNEANENNSYLRWMTHKSGARFRQLLYKRYGTTNWESASIYTTNFEFNLPDVWQHFVFTYDFADTGSTGGKFYKNASEEITDNLTGFDNEDSNQAEEGPIGAWAIGGSWEQTPGTIHGSTFNGAIGIVRYYNDILTPTEVSANYDAEKGRYGH